MTTISASSEDESFSFAAKIVSLHDNLNKWLEGEDYAFSLKQENDDYVRLKISIWSGEIQFETLLSPSGNYWTDDSLEDYSFSDTGEFFKWLAKKISTKNK